MIFVDPDWDYHKLWEHLFPIGVEMVSEAVATIESGKAEWERQDERFATWEPSWERPRLKRNELMMLGGDAGDAVMHEECNGCIYDCRFCKLGYK